MVNTDYTSKSGCIALIYRLSCYLAAYATTSSVVCTLLWISRRMFHRIVKFHSFDQFLDNCLARHSLSGRPNTWSGLPYSEWLAFDEPLLMCNTDSNLSSKWGDRNKHNFYLLGSRQQFTDPINERPMLQIPDQQLRAKGSRQHFVCWKRFRWLTSAHIALDGTWVRELLRTMNYCLLKIQVCAEFWIWVRSETRYAGLTEP